ncbi:hypothetical protein [Pseudonocardia charpentierae]|uniref:Uncharacterized protein n=1 Tax=Pseudonocardia charpentierae TaxID=3075545 RepID=A0ABU2NHQ9_9PSEU|nr:hypothetical protein [Pseudonocardia sp. DSM 45834]MDT0353501.1 hypothetical protein [Pseudonocardia sp. DSM 45834]
MRTAGFDRRRGRCGSTVSTCLVVVAVLGAAVITACAPAGEARRDPVSVSASVPSPVPASFAGLSLFGAAGNPWTRTVARDAPVDPDSRRYVDRMAGSYLVASVRGWTVPVYSADEATPRFDVAATASWAKSGAGVARVPIPERARPDPLDDGHMAVVDPGAGCVYEFWRARRSGQGWVADWVNALPTNSDGVYPDGGGTRAGGFSVVAGLIWPDEIARGYIGHALVFAYPYTRADVFVAPATHTDGRTRADDALPLGARLRLDPALDLDRLDLSQGARTIARALQEFGMILGDTSGGFTLYAAHPQAYGQADPYGGALGDGTWADLRQIPLARMQVMSLGSATSSVSSSGANRCNNRR